MLQARTTLGPGLDATRAEDLIWTLGSPRLWHHLRPGCEWTAEDYQSWLAALLRQQLLGAQDGR